MYGKRRYKWRSLALLFLKLLLDIPLDGAFFQRKIGKLNKTVSRIILKQMLGEIFITLFYKMKRKTSPKTLNCMGFTTFRPRNSFNSYLSLAYRSCYFASLVKLVFLMMALISMHVFFREKWQVYSPACPAVVWGGLRSPCTRTETSRQKRA